MKYKHNSVLFSFSIFSSIFLLQACTVKLVDQTGPNLTSNPPLNIQTFEADVSKTGNIRINGVTVSLDGGGSAALSGTSIDGNGAGRWQGDLAVAACEQAVAYRFTVNFNSNKSKVFPEAGAFVQNISGTDPLCDGIVSASKTYNVNSTEDLPDTDPGDGFCSTDSLPPNPNQDALTCTLRAAIMESNARAGVDLIQVPVGRYTLTRVRPGTPENDATPDDAWGDLDITDSVAIVGNASNSIHIGRFMQTSSAANLPGGFMVAVDDKIDRNGSDSLFTKVDGGSIDRVFDIHVGSGDAEDNGFTLLNKIAVLNGAATDRAGAGIRNLGRLRADRVAVYDNELSQATGPGGVSSQNRGVGIANFGVLIAEEVAIVNNRINGITGFAGGLWVNPNSQTVIRNSLIALNSARFNGGIYVWDGEDDDEPGSLSLTNVTVALNSNTGSVDNAINNQGKLTANFITVIGNNRGGLQGSSTSDTNIRNSLLANNGFDKPDCVGSTVTSAGGNIIKNSTCSFTTSVLNPDEINFSNSVIADSLTHEGGFTYVVRIRPPVQGSTTILDPTDRISAAIPKPDTDQRGNGFQRAADADASGDAEMDPGAYEYAP